MAVVGRKKRGELEGEKKKKRCKWIAQRNESGFTQGCGDKLDSCTRYIGRGQSERHFSSGRPFALLSCTNLVPRTKFLYIDILMVPDNKISLGADRELWP